MSDSAQRRAGTRRLPLLVLAWAWVILPFAYGLVQLVGKVAQLFTR